MFSDWSFNSAKNQIQKLVKNCVILEIYWEIKKEKKKEKEKVN